MIIMGLGIGVSGFWDWAFGVLGFRDWGFGV